MAQMTSELYVVNDLCVGGVSGAYVVGLWRHHSGFPTWLCGILCGYGFRTQSTPRAETQANLHVKFPLFLYDFNKNWNIFQVLTAVNTKITAFWDTTLCIVVKVDRRFSGSYCCCCGVGEQGDTCTAIISDLLCVFRGAYCLHRRCAINPVAVIFKIGMCWKILVKSANIIFHKNTFIGFRVVIFGQTDRHIDMAKLKGAVLQV